MPIYDYEDAMRNAQVPPTHAAAGTPPIVGGAPRPRTAKVLVERLRVEMAARMGRKTGWGKNEVMAELDQAVAAVLADMVEV